MTGKCYNVDCVSTRYELTQQRNLARNIIRQIRNVWVYPDDPMKSALEMERISFTSYSTGEQLLPKSQWTTPRVEMKT